MIETDVQSFQEKEMRKFDSETIGPNGGIYMSKKRYDHIAESFFPKSNVRSMIFALDDVTKKIEEKKIQIKDDYSSDKDRCYWELCGLHEALEIVRDSLLMLQDLRH